jgi:hypothetical protein
MMEIWQLMVAPESSDIPEFVPPWNDQWYVSGETVGDDRPQRRNRGGGCRERNGEEHAEKWQTFALGGRTLTRVLFTTQTGRESMHGVDADRGEDIFPCLFRCCNQLWGYMWTRSHDSAL